MTHTPTPWKVLGYTPYGEDYRITDDIGNDIAIVPHWDDEAKIEARANAAFIVKAVNCHEELLEALKEAKKAIQEQMNCCGESDILMAPMDLIEQALSKAGAV